MSNNTIIDNIEVLLTDFLDCNMNLLLKIRLEHDLDQGLIKEYLHLLNNICINYETTQMLPKVLVNALINARDTIEGAIGYFLKEDDRHKMKYLSLNFHGFMGRILSEE
ncbi:unnamed protein product [Commensalibacter communis]|uniref:hypothetical protein n=1 Tax=Commensalibacter communis TaxID=2972786 RepID=UPI0022FF542A|nr:hypothetical protein [Commensalibacter communis]CAI3931107.1 unnamed protein product [Commensalibacter communis]